MAIELAKLSAAQNEVAEARYWADRAANEKDGYDYVSAQALRIKESVERRRVE